jgi:hypothetical protein
MIEYPIFQSIVHQIDSELHRHHIHPRRFKTWVESAINATGLEIIVDMPELNPVIKSIIINFDWDKFREASMAKQMQGMSKHPLLLSRKGISSAVTPSLDIEIAWQLNETIPLVLSEHRLGTDRVGIARLWMDAINKAAASIMIQDHSLSRWHIDIEGDLKGKYLSQMTFISYLTLSFEGIESLNELHQIIRRKFSQVLWMSEKIISIAKTSLPQAS